VYFAIRHAWQFNFDQKHIDISTDVDLVVGDGQVLDTETVDINPCDVGVGARFSF
jgi:outer membrane protein W